jgi:hypothetical protein
MEPLTLVVGVAAFAGIGVAARMHRRARRAETEAARLRGALGAQRGPGGRQAATNQRPWRHPHPSARRRAQPR